MKNTIRSFIYGIYAGAAIALGGILNIISRAYFGGAGKIAGSLLFPIGLTLVCFLSFNLFTGKIGYFFDNNKKKYAGFLAIIYIGNLVGSLATGFLCLLCFKNVPEIYDVVNSVANSKMSIPDFITGFKIFCGAVLCGALVYIAVFFYKNFKNVVVKVIGIFVPIAVFVYFGFDHCIANMFYFTFALSFSNDLSYLNILLATLGNSLGAIALNSLLKGAKLLIKKQ